MKIRADIQTALGEYFPSLLRRAAAAPELQQALEALLAALDTGSLSWARLNQILHLCSEAGMSESFFRYYFLTIPQLHPHRVDRVFPEGNYQLPKSADEIEDLEQFQWGIRRFMYDAMLYWGNFRQAYRDLRQLTEAELVQLFSAKRVDEDRLVRRGRVVEPYSIPHDNRHLISETACKTFEDRSDADQADHVALAIQAFRDLKRDGKKVGAAALKARARDLADQRGQVPQFDLLFEESDHDLASEDEVLALYRGQHASFQAAREAALRNTSIYLSICGDLDVYVATSMRTRDDFREMARTCDLIFRDADLKRYNLRYFDPTLSAANYHEDKGIIECLMVKTCKVLLYFAQHKESLGKVSEYAMALSLGKPVIILCPADLRGAELYKFYQERHPLLRLIQFETGIVNGAMVTQKVSEVITLLRRIASNTMEYDLAQKAARAEYYLLKERLTQSTVRVITDDRLLTETFWNNYHDMY